MDSTLKSIWGLVFMLALSLVLFVLNLLLGSVPIPMEDIFHVFFGDLESVQATHRLIILESRWPQALTALLTGAGLSVAGLLLQTLFRNPLAGPGILGISAGASLGVALLTMLSGFGSGMFINHFLQNFSLIAAAFLGAFFSLAVVLFFATKVKNNISLLIIGIMMGYAVSSLIGFLQFIGEQQQVHAFILWGLGSFSQVGNSNMPIFSSLILVSILWSLFLTKPLNALLLGENYAANLGVSVKRTRLILIILAGILTAVTTAYTGPIAFIGLAVPHLSRSIFKTSNHKILLPAIILTGMAVALSCHLLARLPFFNQALPINIVTSIFGAPIVIWFLVRNNRSKI
ncbi:MAG: iron ABC transporter [Bacteroidetes bacterium 4572_77]|nr:MAG: iron ABC transporter [Bacteroidetes bacterium 4572_77]